MTREELNAIGMAAMNRLDADVGGNPRVLRIVLILADPDSGCAIIAGNSGVDLTRELVRYAAAQVEGPARLGPPPTEKAS